MHRKKESNIERKNQTMYYQVERQFLAKIKTEEMVKNIIAMKLKENNHH